MNVERFAQLVAVKSALDALHEEFPNSRKVNILHGRLAQALENNKDRFTDEQFSQLGGGTPKTPPPDEE